MKPTMEPFITKGDAMLLRSLLQRADLEPARRAGNMDSLLETLREARVVDNLPGPRVRIDCRVRYIERATGVLREVVLTLPEDAAPSQRRISVLSPLGGALLTRAPGDRITVDLPGDRTAEYVIVEVMPSLEAPETEEVGS